VCGQRKEGGPLIGARLLLDLNHVGTINRRKGALVTLLSAPPWAVESVESRPVQRQVQQCSYYVLTHNTSIPAMKAPGTTKVTSTIRQDAGASLSPRR
jgi:hypothetical protein